MKAVLRLATVVAALALWSGVPAQDLQLGPALDIGTLGVTMGMGEAARALSKGHASRSPSQARRAAASLAFRPSAAVRKRVVEAFIKDASRNDPEGEKKMRALFAKTDPVVSIEGDLAKLGLRRNDLSTGMTAYLVRCWYGAHGRTSSGGAVYRAVSRQTAEVFGANGALGRANDATKQEVAETLLLYGALFEDAVKQAKGSSPGSLAKVQGVIASHAKGTLGIDLAALRLGSSGFY